MLIVYVAGPYRANTTWGVEYNILEAKKAGISLIESGLPVYPVVPHVNTAHLDNLRSAEYWLAGTLELMRRCDAVYAFSENWVDSEGTRLEVEEADRLNKPVFHTLEGILAWIREKTNGQET